MATLPTVTDFWKSTCNHSSIVKCSDDQAPVLSEVGWKLSLALRAPWARLFSDEALICESDMTLPSMPKGLQQSSGATAHETAIHKQAEVVYFNIFIKLKVTKKSGTYFFK